VAVALTTRTNKGFQIAADAVLRWHNLDPTKSIGTWYGVPIPPGVSRVETVYHHLDDEEVIRWITHDGCKHEMPIKSHTHEDIMAVIVAMKLTC
jgi:hypothetical protein